jgi:hypothetical protein
MRRLITLLFILLSVREIIHAQTDCKASNFQRGDVVVVNPNAVQNIREQAAINAPIVESVPVGEYLTVWDGAKCADGYAWWRVEYDRKIGWTAEAPPDSNAVWLSKVDMEPYAQDGIQFSYPFFLISGIDTQDSDWQAHIANYIPPKRTLMLKNYVISTSDRPDYLNAQPSIDIYPRAKDVDVELNLDQVQRRFSQITLTQDALMLFTPTLDDVLIPQQAFMQLPDGTGWRAVGFAEGNVGDPPGDYYPMQPYGGYSFTAFTADGGYYISAYFPLQIDMNLPNFPTIDGQTMSNEEAEQTYLTYRDSVKTALDALPAAAFTPRLALLDAMMRSIKISGNINLQVGQG